MRRLLLLVLCLVCTSRTVSADTRQLVINSVIVDANTGLSLVTGHYFGSSPSVTINDIHIPVLSGSSQMLLVEIPSSVRAQPGTYRLKVDRGSGPLAQDTFSVTIERGTSGLGSWRGVPGPAGPAGPMGPAGPQGPTGLTGPAGATGPTGAVGPAGATGAAGAVGPTGATGATGAMGPMGPTGATGVAGPMGATGAAGPKGDPGPAGAGGLRVIDAAGSEVGLLAPPGNVLREINGAWVQLPLNTAAANGGAGFASCATSAGYCATYYFGEPACQGPAYLLADSRLVQDAAVIDGSIVYPSAAVSSRLVRSFRDDAGDCAEFMGQRDAAEMKSVPLSSLGLVAPFRVAR